MSEEIIVPFQLAPDGSIAVTTNPNRQAAMHIKALLSTSPGERVMLYGYGVPAKGAVFLPSDTAVADNLSEEVTSALATYEPNITVDRVQAVPGAGDQAGNAIINVDWSLKSIQSGSSAGTQTATILVGGQVIS